jgi:hypothetical protein
MSLEAECIALLFRVRIDNILPLVVLGVGRTYRHTLVASPAYQLWSFTRSALLIARGRPIIADYYVLDHRGNCSTHSLAKIT